MAKKYRFRDDSTAIAAHLNRALARADYARFLRSLQEIVRDQNVSHLAKRVRMNRTVMYKTFNGKVNPTVGRLFELLLALGVELTLHPRSDHQRDGTGKEPGEQKLQADLAAAEPEGGCMIPLLVRSGPESPTQAP